MGSIIKTVTFYKRPFWREKGTTSRMFYLNCLFSLEFRQIGTIFFFHFFLQGLAGYFNSDEGPVEEGYDDTKPDGSHPAIMG